jgi:hypothetical protein
MWGIAYENKILVGNSEGKRLLERPGHRCEGNIKMDVSGIYGLDSSASGYRNFVNIVMNF